MDPRDQQLVADYLGGDEKALEILFGRYFKQVYITQKTFLKAWRNLKKFDTNKSFKTWLFAIAKNMAIDFLRKKKDVLLSEAETLINPALSPMALSEKTEKFHNLVLAVGKLPQKYSEIISLRYNSGFSFAEIARFLGEKLNTIKSRHRRGILMLKSAFLHQK